MAADPHAVDFALDELPGEALHAALRRLRAQGPVVPAHFGGQPALVVCGYAALLDAFTDAERFPPHLMYQAAFEPAIGESFISMPERERHLRYRKLATPAFRSRPIERFAEEALAALAHEVIDEFAGQDEVDLVPAFTARFPYKVITRLLGIPREREDAFHGWALALLRFREDPDGARKANEEFTAYFAPVLAERRAAPRDDVISELVAAEVDGRRLSDAEIASHVRLLFPTGGETTHGTLGNLISIALREPGLWERLRAEPRRVPDAVREVLRFESSIAVLPRVSGPQPFAFHGADVPASAPVLFAIAGANRDPAVFPEPDRFDLDRAQKDGLTFGRGVKSCPGAHLARANLETALRVLLERLPALRLVDEDGALPRRSVLRCPEALRVRLRA